MPDRRFLLSVGTNISLLDLRTSVLRQAGYSVKSVTTADEAYRLVTEREFDLVIICHSLPEEQRHRLVSAIKAAKPSMQIMVVEASEYRTKSRLVDESIYNLDGPEQLLASVARQLNQSHGAES